MVAYVRANLRNKCACIPSHTSSSTINWPLFPKFLTQLLNSRTLLLVISGLQYKEAYSETSFGHPVLSTAWTQCKLRRWCLIFRPHTSSSKILRRFVLWFCTKNWREICFYEIWGSHGVEDDELFFLVVMHYRLVGRCQRSREKITFIFNPEDGESIFFEIFLFT